ncbi:hypothetical protein D3C75_1148580 [compost metagenome]
MFATFFQAHGRQHLQRLFLRQRRFHAADEQRHRGVLQRGEIWQQMMELIDKAELAVAQLRFGSGRKLVQRLPFVDHLTRGR